MQTLDNGSQMTDSESVDHWLQSTQVRVKHREQGYWMSHEMFQQSQYAHPSCFSSLAASSRRTTLIVLVPRVFAREISSFPSTLHWRGESVLLHCQCVSLCPPDSPHG